MNNRDLVLEFIKDKNNLSFYDFVFPEQTIRDILHDPRLINIILKLDPQCLDVILKELLRKNYNNNLFNRLYYGILEYEAKLTKEREIPQKKAGFLAYGKRKSKKIRY